MIAHNLHGQLLPVDINLRYLCWKHQSDRSKWPHVLAGWLGGGMDVDSAVSTLSGRRSLQQVELGALVSALGLDEHEFVYGNLVIADGVNVIAKNLERLTLSAGGQSKAELAREIGVNPVTISRWIGGTQTPDARARKMISIIFGLREESDLANFPIFLSYLPITYGEQIAWINASMQAMDSAELRALFPALYRIFATGSRFSADGSGKQQSLKRLRR